MAAINSRRLFATLAFVFLTALIFEWKLFAQTFSPSLGQKRDRASLELKNRLGERASEQLQPPETSRTSDIDPLHPALVTRVINLGLPKAGSSTLHRFFQCGGVSSSHMFCGKRRRCAECIRTNLNNGSTPLEGCGNYSVFSQIDYPSVQKEECYFPQVDALQALYRHYPHAIYLLPRRNPEAWVRSVQ